MFAQGVNGRKWPDGRGAVMPSVTASPRVSDRVPGKQAGIERAGADDRSAPRNVRFLTNAFEKRQYARSWCAFTH
jgi:hypothetical protein